MTDISLRENRPTLDWENNNYELVTWEQLEEAAIREDSKNIFRQLLGAKDAYLKAGLTPVFALDRQNSQITCVAQEDYKSEPKTSSWWKFW